MTYEAAGSLLDSPCPRATAARLRGVYFMLSIIFFVMGAFDLFLYWLPNARVFMQYYSGIYIVLTLLPFFTGTLLRYCRNKDNGVSPSCTIHLRHSRVISVVCSLIYIATLILWVTVQSMYFDTELLYIAAFSLSSVFFFHFLFSLQSLRSLSLRFSLLFSLCISYLSLIFLQLVLSIYEVDYVTVIALSTIVFCYVHYSLLSIREDISSYQAYLQIIVGK